MVALHEVLHDDLPVRAELVLDRAAHRERADPVGREPRGVAEAGRELREQLLGERRGILAEVHPHEPFPGVERDRNEPEGAAVEGGRVLDAQLHVRPGGHFSVTFTDADGTEHTCSGDYVEVEPFSKLSFTWQWKSEPGVQTLVTIAFAPEGTGTTMRFEHSRLFTASAHDYESGWRSTFDKLERELAE